MEKTLTSIVFKCDEANGNGRIYPRSVVKEALDKYVEKGIFYGGAFPKLEDCQYTCSPDRVTHTITDIHMEENGTVVATAKFLKTSAAKFINEAPNDLKFDLAPRGIGEIDKDGVVSDFTILSIDVVARSSFPQE